MRYKPFLKEQIGVLILAAVTTSVCLHSLFGLVREGFVTLHGYTTSSHETYRDQSNPGGTNAFGILFTPVLAYFCWWSILSDWRDARKADKDRKKAESKQDAPPAGNPDKDDPANKPPDH